jgi:lipopolysaccharide transport system ATP-binding protein
VSEIIVSLKNVGLCYKKRFSLKRRKSNAYWALQDVNLEIFHGESIGICGKNGAGKSTLLRVLAGVVSPDRGVVTIAEGIRSGLLTLQSGFNPYLNGVDNAILKGLYMGMKKEYIQSKMSEIIELSGLGAAFYDHIETYSSGMAARLGFAVNYFCVPDLLLIDETLSVGDKQFKQKSKLLIRELIQSNKTVVIVSHDEEALASLTSKVYTLENGILTS